MTSIRPLRARPILAGLLLGVLATVVDLAAAAPPAPRASGGKSDRPNVVLIMADDMGFSDIGCYGGEIETPNLDRLAAGGLRFTQFYNNAKCTTTRASLLTGLYPRRTGPLLKPEMVTIGEALRAAGYHTALSGKWHLGPRPPHRPIDRGFDEFYGMMDGACNYFNPAQPDPPFKGGRTRTWAHNATIVKDFPADFYTTDAISDHAARTIRRFAGEGAPFLVHVCYNAPHYPLHARPADIARYLGKYRAGWEALRAERHRRQVAMGLIDPRWTLPPREREVRPWESDENKEWEDRRMAVYAAMVHAMDRGIGRILEALREAGVEENTVVMFLSDNGGCAELPGGEDPSQVPGIAETYTTCGPGWAYAQNTPFRRYKAWVHEGGISTPLVVRWPGVVQAGSMTGQPGHIIDLMPTLLELAGATYPEAREGRKTLPLEGLSLVPAFRGETRRGHDTLYWEWAGNRAVRQGKWKLVWDNHLRNWELYDLEADRTETHDLASEDPDRVKAMSAAWLSWAARTGLDPSKRARKEAD